MDIGMSIIVEDKNADEEESICFLIIQTIMIVAATILIIIAVTEERRGRLDLQARWDLEAVRGREVQEAQKVLWGRKGQQDSRGL